MKKITFQRDRLKDSLAPLVAITSSRKDVPLTSHVRIRAAGGSATLEATDLETWGTLTVACEGDDGDAEALIPCKMLSDLVDRLTSDVISLEIEGTEITVRGGRGRFPLAGLPADEWPSAPVVEGADSIRISGAELRRLMGVAFARGRLETQEPVWGSVWLHQNAEGTLSAVATDTRRFALRHSLSETAGAFQGALIDAGGWEKAARLLGDQEEVELSTSFAYVAFSAPSARAMVRLIHGSYPNLDRILAIEPVSTARVGRGSLLAAVRLVEVVNTVPEHRVALRFEGDRLSLRTMAGERGFGEQEIHLSELSGEPFRADLNATQLIEMLQEMRSDSVHIGHASTKLPVFLHGQEGERYFLSRLSLDAAPPEL